MSVVLKPHEWDTIPDTAGTLVYERKNNCAKVMFFLFFCSIKTISEWSRMVKIKACCFLPHAVIDNI